MRKKYNRATVRGFFFFFFWIQTTTRFLFSFVEHANNLAKKIKFYKWLLRKRTHTHVLGSMVDHYRSEFVFWRQLFIHEFPSIYLTLFVFFANTHIHEVIHLYLYLCARVQRLGKLLKTCFWLLQYSFLSCAQ